ncbi:hypothetical protein CAOG_08593 [Capsaspora owczarzaki ATCC 30864]|uniref:Uncharacterized protein n=1 Tax=Capsaspora owczarzaki (strain ATCC 30864) TaxID=595528 RepID=A0A0D2WM39_CAPO3|nr:hypothetical protein CAOG_08593 [Capsaspora owczarzaki ATCC 30864]KJE91123.1 hypothetical protein CAOG_008593 [Capsaspora owczarzaki ATCC 30864]|eukprot:XP_011270193.1 hypothetical protein CAOG_08593 [Capsaspora owczarzaki ATCC 30864]
MAISINSSGNSGVASVPAYRAPPSIFPAAAHGISITATSATSATSSPADRETAASKPNTPAASAAADAATAATATTATATATATSATNGAAPRTFIPLGLGGAGSGSDFSKLKVSSLNILAARTQAILDELEQTDAAMTERKRSSHSSPAIQPALAVSASLKLAAATSAASSPNLASNKPAGAANSSNPTVPAAHSRRVDALAASSGSGTPLSSAGSSENICDDDSSSDDEGPLEPEEEAKILRKRWLIVQEIVQTERTYVQTLKLITEVFLDGLVKANKEKNIVPVPVIISIFSNVSDLLTLNSQLLAELETRVTEDQQSPPRIGDVFLRFAPFLKMYTSYIRNFDGAISAVDEWTKKSTAFANLVKQCEANPACRNLMLKACLLEPVQRIPRYKLLLGDYLKKTRKGDPDRADSKVAVKVIASVALHVNESIRQQQNFHKLVEIQSSLVGQPLNLVVLGRVLIREGKLRKMCRKGLKPRVLFLFNDLLLHVSPQPSTGAPLYALHLALPLNKMKVRSIENEAQEHAFQILSQKKSFTLQAKSAEEKAAWVKDITTAMEALEERTRNPGGTNSGLIPIPNASTPDNGGREGQSADKGGSLMGIGLQDVVGATEAPVWVPDSGATMCMECAAEFNIVRRRHHCRNCGRVFCSTCTSYSVMLSYRDNKPSRVCRECYVKISPQAGGTARAVSPNPDTPDFAPDTSLAPFGLGTGAMASPQDPDEEDGIASPHALRRQKTRKVVANSSLIEPAAGLTQPSNSTLAGFLTKQGAIRKNWKRRWFVLRNLCLYYYKAPEDVVALGMIPLPSYKVAVTESADGIDRDFTFKIHHNGMRTFFFQAETKEDVERWMTALEMASLGIDSATGQQSALPLLESAIDDDDADD